MNKIEIIFVCWLILVAFFCGYEFHEHKHPSRIVRVNAEFKDSNTAIFKFSEPVHVIDVNAEISMIRVPGAALIAFSTSTEEQKEDNPFQDHLSTHTVRFSRIKQNYDHTPKKKSVVIDQRGIFDEVFVSSEMERIRFK